MAGHGADTEGAVLALDAGESRHAPQVDEQRRRRQPQLHQRQQRVSARQHLGVLAALAQRALRRLERLRRDVVELGRDHDAPPWACWIAFQTRIGVSGMSIDVTPSGASASSTELTTAGEQAIVAASPTPLTPSVLVGDGVSVRSVSKLGTSAALGSA